MIFRIAAGLAQNRAAEHRWRRVAVPVSAAVFMLLVLAASSVVVMVQKEAERVAARTPLPASKPSPTDLFLVERSDAWGGESYPVFWIEPTGSGDPALPPGMSRLPEPGKAVVSPVLDRLASQHPRLAARYPDRFVLGEEGVRNGDELLAYVRIPEGRTLAEDARDRVSPVMRARAFGRPTEGALLSSLEVPVAPIVLGMLGLLVAPGVIVLAAGLAAASEVRDGRFAVLRRIGAPNRTLFALAVLETLFLAVPGLVMATILWALVSPQLVLVPFVGHDVVRGDLGLPWWLLAAEIGAGLLLTALVALAVTAIRERRGAARPRPSLGRAGITPLRAAPLCAALAAFFLGRVVGGPWEATLNLAGIVATVVGVPLILPSALRTIGAALGRLESVPASVAGRNLEWNPVRAARPFAGSAALIVIVLAGSGYIAAARHLEEPSLPAGEAQTVTVDWLDPQPTDPERLADTLGTGIVVPIRQREGELAVGATCPQLVRYLPKTEAGAACRTGAPFELPTETKRRFIEAAAMVAAPGVKIRLVPEDEVATSGSALVIDDEPLEVLDERVRNAAMRTLPVAYVLSLESMVMRESPLVAWIVGGTIIAAFALTVGCLLSLVDRLLAARKHHRHLLNLGLSPARLATFEAWLFVGPYAAIVVIGFSAGFALCAPVVSASGALIPWRVIAVTLGVAVVTGLVGTASVATFGARSVRRAPE